MHTALLIAMCAFSQDPAAYARDHRLKATSRTLEGRIIMAQLRRDQTAERRAKTYAAIAASFKPLSDEERAANRLKLADLMLRHDLYDGWERCVRGLVREFPDTEAGMTAQLLMGGAR